MHASVIKMCKKDERTQIKNGFCRDGKKLVTSHTSFHTCVLLNRINGWYHSHDHIRRRSLTGIFC